MRSLYGVVTLASVLIRQFVLPNPFMCFGEKAAVINWIAEPIMQIVAYLLVGLVYQKGDMPAVGSALFLVTYAALVGILWLLGIFRFAWWWILLLVIAFVAIVIGIRWICNSLGGDWD